MSDTPHPSPVPPPGSTPQAQAPLPAGGLGPAGAILLALGALALVVVVALAWSWTQVQTALQPARAADAFFHETADQGSAAAWADASPEFRNTPLATWDAQSRNLRLSGFYSAEWEAPVVTGDHATLHGKLKVLGGPDLGADTELRRANGAWRVAWLHLWGGAPLAVAATPALAYATDDQTSLPAASSTLEPPVQPVAPVVDAAPASASQAAPSPLGRAGPPGTAMPSGQVGPTCMGVFWKQGYRNDKVDCPLYLPTTPGRSEQCVVHGTDGTTRGATVTFVDWDPATRQGAFTCALQP